MEFRVEELARRAGVGVDTIRFYQSKQLLTAPRRQGRSALYGDEHLARIRRIQRLKSSGLTLAGVRRVLEADPSGPESVSGALLGALAESSGERSYTRAELAQSTGLPESWLVEAERAGLLHPLPGGEPRYTDADRRAIEAARSLLDSGLPLGELMPLATLHARHVNEIADRSVELFRDWVRHEEPGGAPRPIEEVTAAFRTLLPAVTTLVAQHFQRTLVERARQRLEEAGESADLQAAVAATESSRLRVSWT